MPSHQGGEMHELFLQALLTPSQQYTLLLGCCVPLLTLSFLHSSCILFFPYIQRGKLQANGIKKKAKPKITNRSKSLASCHDTHSLPTHSPNESAVCFIHILSPCIHVVTLVSFVE